MKRKTYAIQIARRHLDLVTLINGGGIPDDSVTKGKHWLIFDIEENGKDSTNHLIVPEKGMFQAYDLIGSCPFIIRVKK